MIPPDGITYKVESNTNVTVSGIDKEIVGNAVSYTHLTLPTNREV